MKKFNFKKQPSIIRTIEEPPVKKKRFNYQRLVYILLLLYITIKVFVYLFNKWSLLEVNGQVLQENTLVQFTDDIRLSKLHIKEGDFVEKGQKLFSYVIKENDVFMNGNIDLSLGTDWVYRERIKTKNEIRFKNSQLLKVRSLYRQHREEKKVISELVQADVYQNAELDAIIERNRQSKASMQVIFQEIQSLRQYLSELNREEGRIRYHNNQMANMSIERIDYRAPVSGIVGEMHVKDNEVSLKGSDVMSIHNTDKVYIKAFINLEISEDLKEGDLVNLFFPDGKRSVGYISKFHITTTALPSEFQKKYEPTERSVVADVIPTSDLDKKNWSMYNLMNVKISTYKYPLINKMVAWYYGHPTLTDEKRSFIESEGKPLHARNNFVLETKNRQ